MPSEVDLRWPCGSFSGREVAEGTVLPGGAVVRQVLGQHSPQMILIGDQPASIAGQYADV